MTHSRRGYTAGNRYRVAGPSPPIFQCRRPSSTSSFLTFEDSERTRSDYPTDPAIHCRRGDRMKRREFITLLGGAAAVWPLAGPRAAVGNAGSRCSTRRIVAAMERVCSVSPGIARRGLRGGARHSDRVPRGREATSIGYRRWTEELVKIKADVIVLSNTAATLAARQFTRAIPLVCMNCTDPVRHGSGDEASRGRVQT